MGWIGGPGGDLLSRVLRHSTMGAGDFHGRVRDGIGCGLPAMATRFSNPPQKGVSGDSVPSCARNTVGVVLVFVLCWLVLGSSARTLSVDDFRAWFTIIGSSRRYRRLFRLMTDGFEPLGRLGPVSFTRYRASTSGLST